MSATRPTLERRSGGDRRKSPPWLDATRPDQRTPSWPEQRMQFITRYLFALIGILYFAGAPGRAPLFVPPTALYLFLGLYGLYNTLSFHRARCTPDSQHRRRIHMWIDIGMVTTCLALDPNTVPVSLLASVLVIMGNGMRYGMARFRECIAATFVLSGAVLALRHNVIGMPLTEGVVFLVAMAAFIIVYCYALMVRIVATQCDLIKHSRFDQLTGLLNRRGLHESVEPVMQLLSRSNSSLTVIFADMDRFKLVNDTKGHAAGDRVLRAVGRMLRRAVRGSDLVARYGGDEFVLILPEATAEQAARVTTTLQRQVRELVDEVGVPFGVSFGVRQVAAGNINIHDLLVEVDREMYRAKHGIESDPRSADAGTGEGACGDISSA